MDAHEELLEEFLKFFLHESFGEFPKKYPVDIFGRMPLETPGEIFANILGGFEIPCRISGEIDGGTPGKIV